MLTRQEYQTIRSRLDRYDAARRKFDPRRYDKGGGYSGDECRQIEQLAGGPDASNAEKSGLEVYEFANGAPDKYFVYVRLDKRTVGTWTGEKLGDIVDYGAPYRSNVGDTRIHVTVQAINGRRYSGTYFQSAGDYARLKVMKG